MTDQKEPISKRAILELIQDERGRLEAVIGTLSEAQMVEPGIEAHRSVKDILAHITDWEQRMIRWIDESKAGLVPQRPAPGMGWDDLDQLNEQIFLENKDRSLAEIIAASTHVYTQAVQAVQTLTDKDLFDGERFAWRNGDPLWHMVAANTWWHYKEHREQIEAWRESSAF